MATTRRYEVDWTDDEVERGGNPPPGWYGARVVDVEENFDNDSIKVQYEILTPAEFHGRKIFDTLWSPEGAKDEEGAKRAVQRQLMVAKRIGILPPEEQRQGTFDVDWSEALGREVYLRVQQRDSFLQPEYAGVYGADDPRVPEKVRRGEQTPLSEKPLAVKEEKAGGAGRARTAGPPPARAAANDTPATTAATSKPQADDWSDL